MAEVIVQDDELVLELTKWERLEAVHGKVRGPKNAWRILSALDTGGSLAYALLGRRNKATSRRVPQRRSACS